MYPEHAISDGVATVMVVEEPAVQIQVFDSGLNGAEVHGAITHCDYRFEISDMRFQIPDCDLKLRFFRFRLQVRFRFRFQISNLTSLDFKLYRFSLRFSLFCL